jgi:hypothetical protein
VQCRPEDLLENTLALNAEFATVAVGGSPAQVSSTRDAFEEVDRHGGFAESIGEGEKRPLSPNGHILQDGAPGHILFVPTRCLPRA